MPICPRSTCSTAELEIRSFTVRPSCQFEELHALFALTVPFVAHNRLGELKPDCVDKVPSRQNLPENGPFKTLRGARCFAWISHTQYTRCQALFTDPLTQQCRQHIPTSSGEPALAKANQGLRIAPRGSNDQFAEICGPWQLVYQALAIIPARDLQETGDPSSIIRAYSLPPRQDVLDLVDFGLPHVKTFCKNGRTFCPCTLFSPWKRHC